MAAYFTQKTSQLADGCRWMLEDLRLWWAQRGVCWSMSVVVHVILLSTTLLFVGNLAIEQTSSEPLVLTAPVDDPVDESELEPGSLQLDPPPTTEVDLTVTLPSANEITVVDAPLVSSPSDAGDPNGNSDWDQLSPRTTTDRPSGGLVASMDGTGPGGGHSTGGPPVPGSFRRRGTGGTQITGRTPATDRAVGLALAWIARHQNTDGSWSLSAFSDRCRDASCTGRGSVKADAAATALGLLPFLASGQTHLPPRPTKNHPAPSKDYHGQVYQGLYWLLSHQKPNGDLSAGSEQVMYTHGLATIAMAEAYAMTKDKQLLVPTKLAVDFIVAGQDPQTGGWRYRPREGGDTSVAGWQIMALKSAQIAGISVPENTLVKARAWLTANAHEKGGLFSYEPAGAVTPSMTAVGLLASQYLGTPRGAPSLVEGLAYLGQHKIASDAPNCYYVYYATQAFHNVPGPEWDAWNRHTRAVLVASQSQVGGQCSLGSWDPAQPAKDAWGEQGGRLMVTALNCLTLQVYYRYLPLYQVDGVQPAPPKPAAP